MIFFISTLNILSVRIVKTPLATGEFLFECIYDVIKIWISGSVPKEKKNLL